MYNDHRVGGLVGWWVGGIPVMSELDGHNWDFR